MINAVTSGLPTSPDSTMHTVNHAADMERSTTTEMMQIDKGNRQGSRQTDMDTRVHRIRAVDELE